MKPRTAVAVVLLQALPWAMHPARAVASDAWAVSTQQPDAIVGEWLVQDKDGRIRFVKAADGTYMGIASWAADPKKDTNNPDPKMRDRDNVGSIIIWHLRYDDGEYVDGYCYNPRDGRTYRIKSEVLDGETMKIRGYLAIPLLGQTQQWTRYHGG
jgi:uncharacterized protein (DUF2147 family)